ncbi:MAG: chromosome segregation protein SMC [Planctomycetota bacterium]|nr:MAG: chromosome segregation protein SMC [Planctomycetota bacterium]
MFIKTFTIRNFRNFRNAKFFLNNKSVNSILGENASGKTNFFYALRLVLDDSLPQNAKQLSSTDFFNGLDHPSGHWVVLSFVFGGLGESDEELVMANHAMQMASGDAEGVFTFAFRPKIHIRQQLFQRTNTEPNLQIRKENVKNYLSGIQIDSANYETVAFVRGTVDYLDDNEYESVAGNFNNYIFPNPDNDDAALLGAMKPPYFSLVKEVNCTYVKALRNVVADMKYSKNNPLFKLLVQKSNEIEGAETVEGAVKQLNRDISDLRQIKELSTALKSTLLKAIGQTYSPSLNITSGLPESIVELIQSLTLLVEDSYGYKGTGKIEDLSLGGANLIYLALKLYEYETNREGDDKIAHFLLIEEPEAHIHNHIQKTLFSNFSLENAQIIISTHSTQISSVSKISSMNVISRKNNYSEVYWPSKGIDSEEVNKIERYLDSSRSTLLFAKSVLLVEGDAEQILIPALIKAVFGICLDELGISLIKMDGTVFKHISSLFDENRLKINCSIITDHDQPFLNGVTDYANQEYMNKLSNSAVNGQTRYNDLNNTYRANAYIQPFFASNTFETELILAGNSDIFINILDSIYTQQARIDVITNHLNGQDSEKCYFALHLAKKVGKGWFAIMLADKVHERSHVPSYIIKSLKHVLTDHDKNNIFYEIMSYRMQKQDIEINTIQGTNKQEKLISFSQLYPSDPLTKLMN